VDRINQSDDQRFNRVYFDRNLNSLFAIETYRLTGGMNTRQQGNKAWDQWVFFTVNHPVVAYETLLGRFFGNFRNENNPVAIEENALSSGDTDFGNAIGALKVDLKSVPRETTHVIFRLGVIGKEQFQEKGKP